LNNYIIETDADFDGNINLSDIEEHNSQTHRDINTSERL